MKNLTVGQVTSKYTGNVALVSKDGKVMYCDVVTNLPEHIETIVRVKDCEDITIKNIVEHIEIESMKSVGATLELTLTLDYIFK